MPKFLVFALAACVPLLAQTEDRIQKSVPAPSPGKLYLTTEMGSIRAISGSGKSVDVEVTFRGDAPSRQEFDRMLKDFSLDVTTQGAQVMVNGSFKNGWTSPGIFGGGRFCNNGRCLEYTWLKDVEMKVTVPQQFDVTLQTRGGSVEVGDIKGQVNAQTSGGSLKFGKIDGTVNGRTSGGSIALTASKGNAVLKTSGGSIRIDDVTGDVEANTSGGSIDVRRATGKVTVHTSGGGINIGETGGPVEASTSGGGITVALPRNKGFDLDASTSGGDVSSDFSLPFTSDKQRRSVHGPVNGGGMPVHLHTSGGGIRIRKS